MSSQFLLRVWSIVEATPQTKKGGGSDRGNIQASLYSESSTPDKTGKAPALNFRKNFQTQNTIWKLFQLTLPSRKGRSFTRENTKRYRTSRRKPISVVLFRYFSSSHFEKHLTFIFHWSFLFDLLYFTFFTCMVVFLFQYTFHNWLNSSLI